MNNGFWIYIENRVTHLFCIILKIFSVYVSILTIMIWISLNNFPLSCTFTFQIIATMFLHLITFFKNNFNYINQWIWFQIIIVVKFPLKTKQPLFAIFAGFWGEQFTLKYHIFSGHYIVLLCVINMKILSTQSYNSLIYFSLETQ